jgi:hypothetical protein
MSRHHQPVACPHPLGDRQPSLRLEDQQHRPVRWKADRERSLAQRAAMERHSRSDGGGTELDRHRGRTLGSRRRRGTERPEPPACARPWAAGRTRATGPVPSRRRMAAVGDAPGTAAGSGSAGGEAVSESPRSENEDHNRQDARERAQRLRAASNAVQRHAASAVGSSWPASTASSAASTSAMVAGRSAASLAIMRAHEVRQRRGMGPCRPCAGAAARARGDARRGREWRWPRGRAARR